jgi:copper chaperone NosL
MKPLVLSLLALAALACQDASSPVDPVWGKQACASCSMLVSDRRYAAQLVTDDGTRVFFDDPGCMATWIAEGRAHAQRMWVYGAAGTWIDARAARFVRDQPSPMGFGFAPDAAGSAEWADVESSVALRTKNAKKGME